MLTTVLSVYIASLLSLGDVYVLEGMTPPLNTQPFTFNNQVATIPVKKPENIAPVIHASSAIAVDMDSGEILYEKNPHQPRELASLTKIMTATIVTEENNLNDVVTISGKAAAISGSRMWLYSGEKIKVENLLYGLLVHSANDAAIALAEYNSENEEAFVKKMNKKAKELHLVNTHYANPVGFDDPNNYSSAYDLSILGKYAYHKQFIRHATSLDKIEVKSESGGIKHNLETTNEVLNNYLGFKGLKTGLTDQAGECFLGIAEKDGHKILTVVLNSPDRFKESKILADWVFRSYTW